MEPLAKNMSNCKEPEMDLELLRDLLEENKEIALISLDESTFRSKRERESFRQRKERINYFLRVEAHR